MTLSYTGPPFYVLSEGQSVLPLARGDGMITHNIAQSRLGFEPGPRDREADALPTEPTHRP